MTHDPELAATLEGIFPTTYFSFVSLLTLTCISYQHIFWVDSVLSSVTGATPGWRSSLIRIGCWMDTAYMEFGNQRSYSSSSSRRNPSRLAAPHI